MLRFYTNTLSRASRTAAAVTFVVGLILTGFGMLIYALPELFATIAALLFFVAGIGCGITAVKILLAQRKLDRFDSDPAGGYRKNVQIHTTQHYEQ